MRECACVCVCARGVVCVWRVSLCCSTLTHMCDTAWAALCSRATTSACCSSNNSWKDNKLRTIQPTGACLAYSCTMPPRARHNRATRRPERLPKTSSHIRPSANRTAPMPQFCHWRDQSCTAGYTFIIDFRRLGCLPHAKKRYMGSFMTSMSPDAYLLHSTKASHVSCPVFMALSLARLGQK